MYYWHALTPRGIAPRMEDLHPGEDFAQSLWTDAAFDRAYGKPIQVFPIPLTELTDTSDAVATAVPSK